MDRIGLLVELMGNDKAMRSLGELKSLIDSLKKDKLRIEAETRGIEKQLTEVRNQIRSLTSKREKIALDTSEIDKATKALERLNSQRKATTNQLADTRTAFRQNAQAYVDTIHRLDREITASKSLGLPTSSLRLQREDARNSLNILRDNFHKQRNLLQKEINELNKQIDNIGQQRSAAKGKRSAALDAIDKQLSELKAKARDFENTLGSMRMDMRYDGTAAKMAMADYRQLERQAISLRDVLSGAGQWFSTIGSGLQSIGGIFNTDVLSYITQTLTQLGTSAVVNNIGKAATRWDTLSTYAPYMEAVGISADRAKASLDEVDQVIQGLPIGLDEAALDIRRTSMLLNGDLETATKFVEGFDQALIAGGAPQQMRNWSYIEMQRLLTSGKLNQSRQWMSLVQGLGVSVPYLKNAMGYGDLSQAEFEANLFSGAYTGEEVIKGFANMADDEELQKLIKIYKGTIESGMSNLHYAMARGLQKTFDAFNEVTLDTTGMGISDYLMSGRNFIDRAFEGIADWVRKNPDTITGILDQVEGLADRAENFDWGSLAHSIIGSIESLVDIATWIYDHVPEPVLEKFITFSMVWASPLGKGFSALGNLLTTMAYLPFPQIGGLTRGMSNMGRFVGSLKSIGKGFLGASAYIGIIAEIGLVIFEFTKVAEQISKADLSGFEQNIGAITKFVGKSGGMAAFLTGIFSLVSALPGGFAFVGAGEILAGGFVALIGGIGKVIGEFANVANDIANAKIPDNGKLDRMFGMINTIFSSISDVDLRLGARMRTKTIDKMIGMLKDLSDAMPDIENIASYDIDTARINDTVQTILGAYEAIDSTIASFLDERNDRTNTVRESLQDADIVSNLTDIIEDLGVTIDAIGGIESKLNEYGFFNSPNGEDNETLTRITDTMVTLVDMMNEVGDSVTDAKGKIAARREEIVTSIETEIIKDWNETVGAISQLITTVHDNQETFGLFSGDEGTEQLHQFKKNVTDFFELITNDQNNGIMDVISKTVYGYSNKRKTEQDWEGLANIINDMDAAMSSIGSILTKLQEYSDDLAWVGRNSLGGTLMGTTFSDTIENFNTLVSSIGTINMESINGMDTASLETNATNILLAINRVAGIGQTLQNNAALFANVNADGGAVYQFREMLKSLMTALSGDGGTISAANYTAMANAVNTLQTSLEGIASVNLSNVVGDIKDMADKLKDLAQKSKDGAKYLNDLRDKIIAAAGAANSNSGKYDGYIRSLSSVATQALRGYDNVSSLVNALNSISDKTININVNTNGLDEAIIGLRTLNNLSSVASGVNRAVNAVANAIRRSHGGKVNYLAKGGTPFKPYGTDTVPAMLTPGEWVINRRASRAFGDNFMRKINAMDIPGAMDALMKRSKWTPSGGVYYTTNNYNNQSVTQNFSREKDSKTSYRRANRYLGAL